MWRPQVFKHPSSDYWYAEYAYDSYLKFAVWQDAYDFADAWSRGLPVDWSTTLL